MKRGGFWATSVVASILLAAGVFRLWGGVPSIGKGPRPGFFEPTELPAPPDSVSVLWSPPKGEAVHRVGIGLPPRTPVPFAISPSLGDLSDSVAVCYWNREARMLFFGWIDREQPRSPGLYLARFFSGGKMVREIREVQRAAAK